jgi:hypothetical protein
MTEFLTQTHLREIARVTEHPRLPPGRLIPRLTWAVDAATGRPVGHWVLGDAHGAPSTRV